MFNKKRKNTLVSHVDDSRSVVKDFRRRKIFESYRPMEYRISSRLQEKNLYAMLDRCLEQLLPGADDGNQNMLNNKLYALGLQSMVDLEQQQIHHQDTIHRLTARWSADYTDLEQLMEAEKKNLEILLQEHQKTCAMLDAYEKGEMGQ